MGDGGSGLRPQVNLTKLWRTAQWRDKYDPVWHEEDVEAVLLLIEVAEAAQAYLAKVGPVYFDLDSEAAGRALEEALSNLDFGGESVG